MLKKLFLISLIIGSQTCWGLNSLSYSGRLVNADGSPVPGPVNLKAELAYTEDTTAILCSQEINTVSLTNGVFHIKLDLDCGTKTITQVLAETPATHSAAIRITDISDPTNPKPYSFQALHSMPFSNISKQLVQMGATDGQVLTWDNGEWKPLAPAAVPAGSVGTNEIEDNSVTNADLAGGIALSKLASGTNNYVLAYNSSGTVVGKEFLTIAQGGTGANSAADARTNLGLKTAATADLGLATGNALAFDDLKFCLSNQKLMMTALPTVQWACVAEETPVDTTKLPLAGGTMTGHINMNSNRITGLDAPVDSDEAVNKDYVDNLFSSVWSPATGGINYASGNVGIGTSTPAAKLDIEGTLRSYSINAQGSVSAYQFTTGYVANSTAYSTSSASAKIPVTGNSTFNLSNIANATSSGSFINMNVRNSSITDQKSYFGSISSPSGYTPSIVLGQQTGLNSYSESMRIDSYRNVGIATISPRSKLDVNGTILGKNATSNSTSVINFDTGNIQYTTSSCGPFALHNVKDGGSYTFIVQGTTSATCSFTAFSDAGTTPLTVHLPPDHGATEATKHTLYSLIVAGTHAYLSFIPGY